MAIVVPLFYTLVLKIQQGVIPSAIRGRSSPVSGYYQVIDLQRTYSERPANGRESPANQLPITAVLSN